MVTKYNGKRMSGKLSKRHGATSVSLYRDDHYLPQAMLNYLLLLGWSHPEEKDVFDVFSLGTNFNLDRFTKSPAIYDINKLKFINGQHIRLLANEQIVEEVKKLMPANHPFMQQTSDWQIQCVNIFKEKMEFFSDLNNLVTILFETHISDEKDYLEFSKMLLKNVCKVSENGEIVDKNELIIDGNIINQHNYNCSVPDEFLNEVHLNLLSKGII